LNRPEKKQLIPIGRIVNTHGIHGKLRIAYYNEDKTKFLSYRQVLLRSLDGDLKSFEIGEAKVHGRFILVQFKGAADLDQVKRLAGADILVEKTALPELEAGEYYWVDLIGMEVETAEGETVGVVSDLIVTGGTDVVVVRRGEKEVLLPASEGHIKEIDVTSRRMVIYPFEGHTEDDSI
jgi:16S rRNA processing protein RimM